MVQLPIPTTTFAPTRIYERLGSVEDITPEFIKNNYILGLKFVDESGKEYPDSWYEQKIATAISRFENYTQMSIVPMHIEGESHDYYIRDYEQYAYLQLYHYPLLVDNDTPLVKAIYPTGQYITTFPREWVRPDIAHGSLQLVPTQGTLSQVILGQGGSYLPIIYQGMGYLPQLFWVTYTAGFKKGTVPQLFLDAISKLTCIELLSVIADSIYPPGVTSQSYSIDGMSESRGYQQGSEFAPIFSGRISQYKRELFGDPRIGDAGLFNNIKSFYRGINMWVVA